MHNSDRFKITKNRFYKYIWAIYNTIAICIVNKVLEKNVRFIGFKLEIKTTFVFSKFRRHFFCIIIAGTINRNI